MKKPLLLLVPCLLVGVLGLTAMAVPGVTDLLTLTVTPDVPVKGGDTIDLMLSDGNPGAFAVLFIGEELGTFPIGDIELDLIPKVLLPLGTFPGDGVISKSFDLPDTLPPEISGLILHLQGVSAELDFTSMPPKFVFVKSNLDMIEFE